ncbi:unnamed protein product [Leptosia nina]|uniref:Uncharacterized protein n=1 Tax=Leptosia nina TaxID=320188 RepID=A0AAV1JPR4_9NEOP
MKGARALSKRFPTSYSHFLLRSERFPLRKVQRSDRAIRGPPDFDLDRGNTYYSIEDYNMENVNTLMQQNVTFTLTENVNSLSDKVPRCYRRGRE